MNQYQSITGRRQHGAALAVSLILLLVMTIVGVAAMNGARLEVSMAGLIQEEQQALRRSERALRDAEVQVDGMVGTLGLFEFTSEEDEEDGMYGPDAENLDEIVAGRDWSGVDTIQSAEYTNNDKDDDDAIIIQYLGSAIIPGENYGVDGEPGVAGSEVYVYRISTRSATGSKSVRIIESTYTTFEAP